MNQLAKKCADDILEQLQIVAEGNCVIDESTIATMRKDDPAKAEVFAGICELHRKVEAQKEAILAKESEIAKRNEERSNFLNSMSHDIRTPIGAMLGAVDLLEEEQLSEQQSSLVEMLRTGSNNLLNLVNDILDLSKIDAGRRKYFFGFFTRV